MLDEPCAGVNPHLVEQLGEKLLELNRSRGGSFVIVEHNMDFVMRLCPRVICMAEGRILAHGTPAEIQSNQAVLEAYLGN
jgi:branched-chain amino acid transport system ATP-binding protein